MVIAEGSCSFLTLLRQKCISRRFSVVYAWKPAIRADSNRDVNGLFTGPDIKFRQGWKIHAAETSSSGRRAEQLNQMNHLAMFANALP
jgi:hypothetical protein